MTETRHIRPDESLAVVTFLWDDGTDRRKYLPEHVNWWARQVKEHLPLPHEVICVVDEPTKGFSDDVRQVVLPESAQWTREVQQPNWPRLPSSYRRLWCFSAEAQEYLADRILLLDIDCMIVGDMTPLFNFAEDFVGWRPKSESRTRVRSKTGIKRIAGGTWLLRTGTHTHIWEEFKPDMIPVARREGWRGSDQAWLSHKLASTCKVFPQRIGIYHTQDGARQWRMMPGGAIIIHFNGVIKPWDEEAYSRPWFCRYKGVPFEPDKWKHLAQKIRPPRKLLGVMKPRRVKYDVTFLCYWWDNWPDHGATPGLGLQYLDNLAKGIRINMPKDVNYQLLCITDKPGFVAKKTKWQAVPIVNPSLLWNLKKMQMYSSFGGHQHPHLCFDLDVVITGGLKPLIDLVKDNKDKLITCEAAYSKGKAGGSIIGFYPIKKWHDKLWLPLVKRQKRIERKTGGSERFYYRGRLDDEDMLFWQDLRKGLVLSYKKNCRDGLPPGSAVVRFHGKPRVHEAVKNGWVDQMWNRPPEPGEGG